MAGVEGTGHHLIGGLLEPWCTDVEACVKDRALSQRLWSLAPFSDTRCRSWQSNRDEFQRQLRDLKTHFETSRHTGNEVTLFFNGLSDLGSELSYPNYGGDTKAWQHPDARMLAEVCEREKIDFRIVVLERPVTDILVSTTVHRGFGTFMQEGRILNDNMAVLTAQLLHLDPAFYSCLPLMSDLKSRATLRHFAHFTGIASSQRPFKKMKENIDKASSHKSKKSSSPSWNGDEAQFLHLFQNTERLLHSRVCGRAGG